MVRDDACFTSPPHIEAETANVYYIYIVYNPITGARYNFYTIIGTEIKDVCNTHIYLYKNSKLD